MSYAKVLGATNRQDGYLEGNGYLVSWCVGHLVELAPPNVYDAKYVKWSIADLPILPQKWQYLVSVSTKKQFGILQKLMHRPDVDSIVNSCDAGREGELIFRLVYQQAGCKKPFSRLWLSSMEESAIREGFAHLKPSTEYDALYNAALCRERADWMVGINASRLFSCLYGQPLAVGRVMTPVLAMTVVREAAIAAFVPEKFYTVDLELTSGCTASSRRIPEKAVAEKLMEACRKEMVATIQRITRKEKSENPPPLYDLTTLQRDANRLLGYSAQQTLDYVQSLYEKKLTTYPRTDSCYITDDDEEMLEELTEALEVFLDITPEDVDEAVPRTRRTVNREKVTDHHAILPTRSMLQADLDALPKGEQNVLKLIIARTLMAVSKPFRYLETLLLVTFNHQCLIATKANRICRAAAGRPVMEFGARRAQGYDAAYFGARASYIGGCSSTSCVMAARDFGIPASGTMAHSWVQMFPTEYDAFKKYAEMYPDNCVLLVDTYNVLRHGVPDAIKVFDEVLKPMGKRPKGVRIDSGDIAYLSKKARQMLDAAGYPDCTVCASNSLDEYIVRDLILQGARVDSFGIGENMITAKSDPVFGGVYKLAAVKEDDGSYTPKMKLSESVEKMTIPCLKKVWRIYDEDGKAQADLITMADEVVDTKNGITLFDPIETWKECTYVNSTARCISTPIYENGKRVYTSPNLADIRKFCKAQVGTLWDEVKRFENPHRYYVDLSRNLWDTRSELLKKLSK